MIHEKCLNYTVVFQPAEEGGYTVFVPAIPGCITQGDTLDEARRMAKEAIELCVESLQTDGAVVPNDVRPIIERIQINASPA